MFIMVAGMVWIGIFMRDNLKTEQADIKTQSKDLNKDVNSTVEEYDRLDKRQIGHGKHLKTMQESMDAHYEAYDKKIAEIKDDFERVDFQITDLTESMTQKIDGIKDEIAILTDEFATNKRKQNRTNLQYKMDIQSLKDELDALDRELNPEKYEKEKD